jgi:hydroxyacylglutathione hydrolase
VPRILAIDTPTLGHRSYVTGGYALAAQTDAAYHVNAEVYGSVGRPDLLGPPHTETLAHHQYTSASSLAAELPDVVGVYPTHGFGSFCSATPSEASSSTIGQEKRANPALTTSERQFVADLLAGLDAWPAYYTHVAPANSTGPDAPDLSPPERADAGQIRTRLSSGAWVVDLRCRVAFAAGHVAGSFNFGLDGSFATYLGWLIPWGIPIALLGETPAQVAQAQRELVRIGIDRPAAHATGTPAGWAGRDQLATLPRATFVEFAQVRHHRPVVILDNRRNLEWATAHIDGAVHIPLHDLLGRVDEVPDGEVWVHCAAGYRASIAASILAAAGRRVVAVDDEFDHAATAGLAVVTSR